jgi:alcohol dehydrogenase
MELVNAAGVKTFVFSDIVPDLPLEGINASVSAARTFEPDLLIAIGGGSSIDMAKVTAMLLAHGGSVRDYYGEFRVPGPILPVVAIPTTAGTGSEATPVAVVTDPERISKVGISSPFLIPRVALCDPELTYSCPPAVTASSGADALAHCIESFTAVRRAAQPGLTQERVFVGRGEITDGLASLGIRHLAKGLHAAYREPSNTAARADVMLGSLLAGLAFGTAGTAAAHAIQYPVGAFTHTPHGLGVGTLLPYVMEFNLGFCIPEMAAIARALGETGSDSQALAAAAPRAVARLLGSVGIPASLADLGFPEDHIDWAAQQAVQAARLAENNPRPLTVDGARSILKAAHQGKLAEPAAALSTVGEIR